MKSSFRPRPRFGRLPSILRRTCSLKIDQVLSVQAGRNLYRLLLWGCKTQLHIFRVSLLLRRWMEKQAVTLQLKQVFKMTICKLVARSGVVQTGAGSILTSKLPLGSTWNSRINRDCTSGSRYFKRAREHKVRRNCKMLKRSLRKKIYLPRLSTSANHQCYRLVTPHLQSTSCIKQGRQRITQRLRSVTRIRTQGRELQTSKLWWRHRIPLLVLKSSR